VRQGGKSPDFLGKSDFRLKDFKAISIKEAQIA
jgi:hypothetical protein